MDRGLLRDAGDEISASYDENFLFGWPINDCATIAHVPVSYKMPPGVKPLSEADKRAAIELWKAAVPLQRIREQLLDTHPTSLEQLQGWDQEALGSQDGRISQLPEEIGQVHA